MAAGAPVKTTQLRDYTIKPGQLDRFVEVWRTSVRPLREKTGFVVEGAWKVPSEEHFVWIVSYAPRSSTPSSAWTSSRTPGTGSISSSAGST